jgi:Holliday junction resolvasome RuvABC endonuclease subunit
LTTGLSLQNYADAVTKVLEDYQNNFSTLEFIYTEDNVKAAQKIFYASIQFAFLNWAQTEIFDIYAINDWELTSTVE